MDADAMMEQEAENSIETEEVESEKNFGSTNQEPEDPGETETVEKEKEG